MTVIVLDKELEQRLETQAARAHRHPSDLAADAIRNYLEYEEWFVQAVEEGIRAADAGEFADDAEVEAFFARWESDAEGQVDHAGAA